MFVLVRCGQSPHYCRMTHKILQVRAQRPSSGARVPFFFPRLFSDCTTKVQVSGMASTGSQQPTHKQHGLIASAACWAPRQLQTGGPLPAARRFRLRATEALSRPRGQRCMSLAGPQPPRHPTNALHGSAMRGSANHVANPLRCPRLMRRGGLLQIQHARWGIRSNLHIAACDVRMPFPPSNGPHNTDSILLQNHVGEHFVQRPRIRNGTIIMRVFTFCIFPNMREKKIAKWMPHPHPDVGDGNPKERTPQLTKHVPIFHVMQQTRAPNRHENGSSRACCFRIWGLNSRRSLRSSDKQRLPRCCRNAFDGLNSPRSSSE